MTAIELVGGIADGVIVCGKGDGCKTISVPQEKGGSYIVHIYQDTGRVRHGIRIFSTAESTEHTKPKGDNMNGNERVQRDQHQTQRKVFAERGADINRRYELAQATHNARQLGRMEGVGYLALFILAAFVLAEILGKVL